jgi:predicted ATP-grasp superfamily ATP-dependent carboligase
MRSLDKTALVEEAEHAGFSVLESAACGNEEDAFAAAAAIGYPVVVKPRRSVVGGSTSRRAGASVVGGPAELGRALRRFGGFALVQRYEQAAAVLSIGGVATAHGLAAVVAARWARRWPPLDGAASFAETVAPPAVLLERVEALLRRLRWYGIFELELLELRPGAFAPIDFNPRPFGWMTLAVRAGANLPAIWLDCLHGAEPRCVIAGAGIRYRWEEGEVRHLLWQLRRRRLRAAAAVVAPRRRVVHAHFELRDPAPFAAAAVGLARRSLRRPFTTRARARSGGARRPAV